MTPIPFRYFFLAMLLTAGTSITCVRPPLLPFIGGLAISDALMGLAHRFLWHSTHPWLRLVSAAHATHHQNPGNSHVDSQDVLAFFTGALLLPPAALLGSGLFCGVVAYYPLALMVHDEFGHGRVFGHGSWRGSRHARLHHTEPTKHFTVMYLECVR